MRSGETVLVTAAAGGTGQFVVQLAKVHTSTLSTSPTAPLPCHRWQLLLLPAATLVLHAELRRPLSLQRCNSHRGRAQVACQGCLGRSAGTMHEDATRIVLVQSCRSLTGFHPTQRMQLVSPDLREVGQL
jgi:hypothetical protein